MSVTSALGLAIALAIQAPAARTPYVHVLLRYGPGSERDAVYLLGALKIRSVDRVFEALDRACVEEGAKSCLPGDLEKAAPPAREKIAAIWRQLYPRAMALHAEALVDAGTTRDETGVVLHAQVLLRLAARCAEIGRLPDAPPAVAPLAATGPHLVVWALQYLRDDTRLERALDLIDRARIDDADIWLARGALAELRISASAIAAADRRAAAALERKGGTPEGMTGERQPVDTRAGRHEPPDGETARRLEAAVRVYRQVIAAHPDLAEGHLRLGRLLAQLERVDEADRELGQATALRPDARQAYLAALFVADLRERQDRLGEAAAAYADALRAWPDAQAPVVALARLRVLSGAPDAARAMLAGLYAERGVRERSDPWRGYVGCQGWRLAGALAELKRDFEAVR